MFEGLEDPFDLVSRDSDPRVRNDKMQEHVVVAAEIKRYVNNDLTLVRELDGIGHQVHNDLAKAVSIPHQPIGHISIHAMGEFDALGRRRGAKRVQNIRDPFAQLELDGV